MLNLKHMNAAVEISDTVYSLKEKSEVFPLITGTEVYFIYAFSDLTNSAAAK